MTDTSDLALKAKAWPFEVARKPIAHTKGETPEKGYLLNE
jgi:hypothetical protein